MFLASYFFIQLTIENDYLKKINEEELKMVVTQYQDAKAIIAHFLQKSEDAISCKTLRSSDEATVVKCTHLITNYIVKFFSTSEFGKNEITWTQHASDLGIGPKLYYADPNGSYMAIEFMEGNSLVPAIANTPAVIKSVATSVAKLHSSCASSARVSDMWARIDAKYKKLKLTGELKDIVENCIQHVKKIKVKLQNLEVSPTPCHNDLNPGNIFVNNDQVTFIDWGDAALGNPYYDIAAFFILNIITKESENLFFEQYNAKLLNPQWQAYMQLYKQVVYFEFALNLLLGVQSGKNELLHMQDIPKVNTINYYLTLLAKQEVEIDNDFLYAMAIASLAEIK